MLPLHNIPRNSHGMLSRADADLTLPDQRVLNQVNEVAQR